MDEETQREEAARVRDLEAQANAALKQGDRPTVASVREEVRGILAVQGARPTDGDASALEQGITQALDAPGGLLAECREADPFATAYLTLEDGIAWYRCAHDPSHKVRA